MGHDHFFGLLPRTSQEISILFGVVLSCVVEEVSINKSNGGKIEFYLAERKLCNLSFVLAICPWSSHACDTGRDVSSSLES